jgi:hypothetical protein
VLHPGIMLVDYNGNPQMKDHHRAGYVFWLIDGRM